ncbi:MAG: RnfABCDGE type electron transport complex subunit G, partial [Bacillota bacterium]|nr:RnfABCDGE type electron transport complex subunit G [Bacillota bacterium]
LGLILFTVTFITALLLGLTNALTKDRIAFARKQQALDAMKLVQASADEFAPVEAEYGNDMVKAVYEAKKGGEIIGYCVEAYPRGFRDTVQIMVGIGSENAVTGVSVISISDTPGLGAKAADQLFLNQFAGKSGPLTVTKGAATGDNDILALTGATITSKGVTSGVQAALDCVSKLRTEGIIK